MADSERLTLIASVAGNYLRRNSVGVDQIETVISNVTRALDHATEKSGAAEAATGTAESTAPAKPTPAVPIKKSIQREYLVCLEDGVHARTLKRHLQSAHGMTPQQYREKWGLQRDYPMTAPAYSERRSEMAKTLGLGRKSAGTAKRGRRRAARAEAAT
jgi:predicted transcriptional regulator